MTNYKKWSWDYLAFIPTDPPMLYRGRKPTEVMQVAQGHRDSMRIEPKSNRKGETFAEWKNKSTRDSC